MPELWRAWADAWEALGSDDTDRGLVDAVLSGSKKHTRRFPSRRTARVVFATVFTDGAYGMEAFHDPRSELVAKLRSPKTYSTHLQVTEAEVERIGEVVQAQTERLLRTCRFYQVLDRVAEHVMSRDRSEALLGLAVKLTYQFEALSDAQASAAADSLNVLGPETLKEYLAEPANANVHSEALAQRWAVTADQRRYLADDKSADVIRDRSAFWRFLGVRQKSDPMDTESWSFSSPRDWWDEIKNAHLGPWPPWARVVHLTSQLPIQAPPLRNEAESSEFHFVSWLDSSIESRLVSALRADRSRRVGLPSVHQLVDGEVDRACMALGLVEAESRVLLVLGEMLTQQVSVDPDAGSTSQFPAAGNTSTRDEFESTTTRAADHVRRHLKRWRAEQEVAKGMSGIPHVWASALADPTPYFVSYLWTRVHNAEILGGGSRSADEAYDLLTGIGHTLTDRLKSLPTDAFGYFAGWDDRDRENRDLVGQDLEQGAADNDSATDSETVKFQLLEDLMVQVRDGVVNVQEWESFWRSVFSGQIPGDAESTWEGWAAGAGVDVEWTRVRESMDLGD